MMSKLLIPKILKFQRQCFISYTASKFGPRSRWVAPTYRAFNKRDKLLKEKGISHDSKRSEYIEWNYNAELFAFCKRLNEEINDQLLRQALMDKCYLLREIEKQKALDVDTPAILAQHNEDLASLGSKIIYEYCSLFIRNSYPLLPKEGIDALLSYLLSDDVLHIVGYGTGLKDLIQSSEYPPSSTTTAKAFKAIAGAIYSTTGIDCANKFVQDFVITQLVGMEIHAIWKIEDPMSVLSDIMHRSNHKVPEPRLIFKTGSKTLEAVYHVGLYVDKQFLSQGYGETTSVAVESAAQNALNHLFGIEENSTLLQFNANRDLKELPIISLHNWVTDLPYKLWGR